MATTSADLVSLGQEKQLAVVYSVSFFSYQAGQIVRYPQTQSIKGYHTSAQVADLKEPAKIQQFIQERKLIHETYYPSIDYSRCRIFTAINEDTGKKELFVLVSLGNIKYSLYSYPLTKA